MKSSAYSKTCLRIFHRFVSPSTIEKQRQQDLLFEKARICIPADEYYSVMIMNTIIAAVAGIAVSLIFFLFNLKIIADIFIIFIPLLSAIITYFFYASYPESQVKHRAKNIDRYLPFAVNFISTMTESGVSPGEMFQTLSTTDIYGEIQHEARKITQEINVMGIDNNTALEHGIERTPSIKFKTFLQGLFGTLQAGSSVDAYLNTMVHQYMKEDLLNREKNLEFLALIAELFVMSAIAFPLFLVIIISVMGFVGDSGSGDFQILYIIAFVMLPILYSVFLFMIKSTILEEVGKSKSETAKPLSEILRQKSMKVLYISIGILCLCYLAVFLLVFLGNVNFNNYLFFDLIFISVLVLIGPYAFFMNAKMKREFEIQDRLPEFLVGIANSLSAGMNIFDGIRMLTKRNYARLTQEVKKMNAELSWRLPIKRVFHQFAERVKNPLISRSVISINRGLEMGGNTSRVFEAAAREIKQVNQVKQQRQANMSMYTVVIIMCFFVFLFIMLILDNTLFSYFYDVQVQQTSSQGFVQTIDQSVLHYGLCSFVFVQAIGSGILAGYFTDGNVASGMRFSFLLGVVSMIAFRFFF